MASKEAIDAALQVPSSDNRSLQYVICRGLPPMKFGASEQEADRLVGVALAAAATIDGDYNAGIEAAMRLVERYRNGIDESARGFPDAEPITDQVKGMLNDLVVWIEKLKRPE